MLIAQAVNIIVAPLQALLIVPFYRIGYRLLPNSDDLYFDMATFTDMLRSDFFNCLGVFWKSIGIAIIVWVIASIPIGFAVYFLSRGLVKNYMLIRQH